MKKILLSAILCSTLFASNSIAQLPDGSIAPDFTTVDINGNTHNLYDYLDQGYTVVMDISATWCPPCWSYHQGGALEDLWANHGPAGLLEFLLIQLMMLWYCGLKEMLLLRKQI